MRQSRRRFLSLAALAPLALAIEGCLGSRDPGVTVIVEGAPVTTRSATATAVRFMPTPPRATLDAKELRGFTMPIKGACLPSGDQLMPNAPRTYRRGVHEGVDFYNGDACVAIARGTPVIAMYPGVVVRADHDYRELTAADVSRLAAIVARESVTDEQTLDAYRGRQVWIDHGGGIVTRTCHLSAIAGTIAVGLAVRAGDPVGNVGESGTPESVTAPGTELHLHAEVRIGDSFLGSGLPPAEVRRLYTRLFQPA